MSDKCHHCDAGRYCDPCHDCPSPHDFHAYHNELTRRTVGREQAKEALHDAEREVLAACVEWRSRKPVDWTVARKKIAEATDKYLAAEQRLKEVGE